MLKLQEIQHYNGLKFMVTGSQRKNILMSKSKGDGKYQLNTVYSLHGINKWHVIPLESLDPDSNLTSIGIEHIKPILFPLSYFIDNRSPSEVMEMLSCGVIVANELYEMHIYGKSIGDIIYKAYLTMSNNFIDFQDLIGQGKAVSVLDFDVNPYK